MESYEPSTSKVGSTKPSKPKYNTNCSVYGCHSRKAVDRSIHFHGFPDKNSGILVKITNASGREEEMDKRQAWEKVLLMGKPVTKFMKVCSKHFKTTDYLAKGVKMKQPKLNRFAVPSENLPKKRKYCENVDDNSSHPRRKRLAARQEIEDPLRVPELCGSEVVKEEIQSNNCSNDFVQRSYHQLSENEKVVVANLSSLHASENTFCVDKQVQVSSGDVFVTFTSTVFIHLNYSIH
nr:unnamed protein product [Callosobruchus chinensis]